MSSAEGPRFSRYTAHNHQAWLWIVTSMSLTYAFMVLGMRLIVKWKFYGLDDAVLAGAYALSLAQWALMYSALDIGVGKDSSIVELAALDRASTLIFVARILVLLALSQSKCCIVLFIRQLFTKENRKAWRMCTGLSVLAALWGLASSLVFSVGCSPTALLGRIKPGTCSSEASRWRLVAAAEVVFEVLIALLATYLFSTLRMQLSRKLKIIAAFVLRLPTAALALAFLYAHLRFLEPHSNASLAIVPELLWMEALLSYALMSCTIPCLKGFLGRFQTGDLARLGESSISTSRFGTYGARSRSGPDALASSTNASKHEESIPLSRLSIYRSDGAGHSAFAYGGRHADDGSSVRSDGSQQMIIQRRTEIDLRTEDARPRSTRT